jgi:ABC-type multidrug transport system fused ATPase/permease subunit
MPARRELLESVRRRLGLAVAVVLVTLVSAGATAGYAWMVGPLLRTFEGNSGLIVQSSALPLPDLSVTQIVWLLVLLGLVRAFSETVRANLSATLQLSVIREFRGKVLAHVLRAEPSTLLRWPSGELASRIQVEVHGVRTFLHMGVTQGIRSILMATALASVALAVDSALAIPGLLVVPFAAAAVVFAARPARKLQRELFAAESSVVADTAEAIEGAAVLRAYGAVDAIWAQVDEGAARSEGRGIAAETWSTAAGPLVELASAVGIAVVFALAWTTRGSLDLAASGTVLVALVLMYRPLHGLAQAVFGWWSGLASLDRLDELLCVPVEPLVPAAPRPEDVMSLGFEDLRFDYDGQPVLRGATASFRGGELVAITGGSGAGKSTLLRVLAGVLPVQGGHVSINGIPAQRTALTAATAWMPQNPALFRATILNNVALGAKHPDRARVLDACRRVDAHEFIAARPQAYDAILQEGGTDLSMGQRQRITLARALFRSAPALLLDEPTSALDDEQEQNVIRVCREHADLGGLVILATHREDFLRDADRVLELRDGMVIEWERRTADALLH